MLHRQVHPKVVVFDLDGTLYDKSGLPLRMVLSDPLRAGMMAAERRTRRMLAGRDFGDRESLYDAFFKAMSPDRPDKAREWYFGRYLPRMVDVLRRHYVLRPWAEDIFHMLRVEGIRTVVLSDYDAVEQKLRAVGFDPGWADLVCCAPELGGLKPCPEAMGRLLSHLGVEGGQCLVVGDRDDTDGAAARSQGMGFLQVDGDDVPPVLLGM